MIFVLSPYADLQGTHSLFSVNHRIENGHSPGGFQNQIWSGSTLVRAKKGPTDTVMNTLDEVITFAHVMQVNTANFRLNFDVINLQSSTWGTLTGNFANTFKESGITDLNQFSLATTIDNSGVAAGRSRVESMDLLRVRTYTQTGLLSDVSVNQCIYSGVYGTVETVETVNGTGQFVPQ